VFFESEVIKNEVLQTKFDKISVCSWELKSKMKWYIGRPRELTQELLESDYEVMSFTKNTGDHRMFAAADAWHPGFMKTFDKILSVIGVRRPGEIKIPIYQNHHASKTGIYQDYVNSYLIPAMEAIKNDPEINGEAMADANYSKLKKTPPPDYFVNQIGVPFWPMVPFLLERLFSVYVQNKQIKITHL
jgi:hypothetical protein